MQESTQSNTDLQQQRLHICYRCPIYSSKYDGTCNDKLWLKPETGEVATSPIPGFKRGCGCLLQTKTLNPIAVCPAGKW